MLNGMLVYLGRQFELVMDELQQAQLRSCGSLNNI
jgi:hypothetical protein